MKEDESPMEGRVCILKPKEVGDDRREGEVIKEVSPISRWVLHVEWSSLADSSTEADETKFREDCESKGD